ncbi:MAG: hypothetical protein B5M48_04770 [Candidatus Omnitrophica bacterium 4484_213]|nr:MAG: hypothetical protein B5M48_04770 [Candidatus Omnitrophica bacterium 4484_213]
MTAEIIENAPRALITPEAKQRLDLYIKLASYEISGLGKVQPINQRDIFISDVFILEQEVSFDSTELDSKTLSKWLTKIVQEGKNPVHYKCWWHSHNDMRVFWSNTDRATIEKFGSDWMVSIVGNKRGDYLVRLDIFQPFRLTVDNLKLEMYYPENPSLKAKIQREIKAKVKKQVYHSPFSEFSKERKAK